jgi:hypothetical protein
MLRLPIGWLPGSLGVKALLLAVPIVAGCWLLWGLFATEKGTGRASSLEEEWSRSIRQLGIEPVFPPEEDLAVGDILAVVVADNDPSPSGAKVDDASPFLRRSVKIAHLDVRKELEAAYAVLPFFAPLKSDVPPSAVSGSEAPARRPFTQGFNPADLPRAAFPSVKIQANQQGNLGFFGNGFLSFSLGAEARDTEELQLSDVRVYGLPNGTALRLLKKHCSEANNEDHCSEMAARRHLEASVGSRIFARYWVGGGWSYGMRVEIVLVSRVYLTNSIMNRRRAESVRGGRATGLAKAGGPAVPAAPVDPAAKEGGLDGLRHGRNRAAPVKLHDGEHCE